MKQGLMQMAGQLAGIWKQLGLNQRLSVVIATGALLAGIAALAFFSSRVSYSLLFGRLDDTEAGRVIAALDEEKVPYQVRSGAVYVPADRVHAMRMQLAAKGLGRQQRGVGYEIFDQASFGLSDFMQQVNLQRAREGELARTICQIDAVEAAQVHLNLPRNRLLIDQDKKPTASVMVRVRGNARLSSSEVNAIRFLIANSTEGLQPGQVSVVDNLGNVLSENQEDNSLVGVANSQLKAQREYEKYLSTKAEEMLDRVLGHGQSVVRVAAEINFDTLNRFEEKFDPESQIVRTSTVNDEEVKSTTATTGGAPGVASNTAESTNNVAAASPSNTNTTRKKETVNQYEVNKIVSSLQQSPGNVKRLSAAVFVAQRFEGTGANRKPLTRPPEELQKLRRIVQNALGIQEGDATRTDEIALEEMAFNEQPMIEMTQTLDRQQQRQFWMDLGYRLLYPALGLVVVFLFWRSFRRARDEDFSLGLPLADFSAMSGGESGGNGKPHRTGEPKVVTAEVLNQLIRENPSNMTQAVRNWLTRGKPVKS